MEKKLKRIVLDVDPEIHRVIKISATENVMSMRIWILKAISDRINKEKLFE